MPRYCRPIFLPELAELIWPGVYTHSKAARRNGARRARRFLRRLERHRGKKLLHRMSDGKKRSQLYTTMKLLRPKANEMLDYKTALEQEIAQRWETAQTQLVVLRRTVKMATARQKDANFSIVNSVQEIQASIEALGKRIDELQVLALSEPS
jgi:hypothetical protein